MSVRVVIGSLLLSLGFPLAASAQSQKIDENLAQAISNGCGTSQPVIIRTVPGYRALLRQALEAHGDTIKADHQSIHAISVDLHCADLQVLAASSSIVSISSDAPVTSDGAPPITEKQLAAALARKARTDAAMATAAARLAAEAQARADAAAKTAGAAARKALQAAADAARARADAAAKTAAAAKQAADQAAVPFKTAQLSAAQTAKAAAVARARLIAEKKALQIEREMEQEKTRRGVQKEKESLQAAVAQERFFDTLGIKKERLHPAGPLVLAASTSSSETPSGDADAQPDGSLRETLGVGDGDGAGVGVAVIDSGIEPGGDFGVAHHALLRLHAGRDGARDRALRRLRPRHARRRPHRAASSSASRRTRGSSA